MIITRVLERRHFWRYASFSEIAELYTARTLRVIAISLASGFASVYLYQEGYSLTLIMTFWGAYYFLKVLLSLMTAHFAAHFGSKHGILVSNILYIPAMVILGFVPVLGFAGMVAWGIMLAISTSLYNICYSIDFSKVKNGEHAGKELAFMNILEKVSLGITPIIGGLVALWFGPSVVMWVSAFFFMIAAFPLLRTVEQVHSRQKISYKDFPWRMALRSMFAQVGIGFDVVTTGNVWSLFIAIVILPGAGNEVYVTLGILSSVTIVAAIVASYAYGKLIDRSKGGALLKMSVIANSLVHVSRAFASTPVMVVGTNITNEVATMGYNMAFTRGTLDTADLSGHRIVYLSAIDSFSNFGASIACITLIACISVLGNSNGLRIFFFFAAAFVLLISTANFRLYRK
jgi:MFS family permease